MQPRGIEEPLICSGCGILRASQHPACRTCHTPASAQPLRALAQPNGGYWVAVQASFTCNACRFDSPLNHFELGEGVLCTRCGLEQRYNRSNWRDLAKLAHRVGDLGAGGPQGRFPDPDVQIASMPFPDLGTSEAWVRSRPFMASPGNPLCTACKAPRVVVGRREDAIDVACSGCGQRRTYELPEVAKRLGIIAGVLADEHETSRREVTVTHGTGGVVALGCPSCGAPLENVGAADGVVSCGYCGMACRISTRTHALAGHKETPTKTWWLYFEQPSSERRELLNRARKVAQRAQQRARSQAGAARAGGGKRANWANRAKPEASPVKWLLPVMLVPVVAVTVISLREQGQGKVVSQRVADEKALERFSFAMTPAQTRELFGVAEGSADISVEFADDGVIRRARFTRGLGPTFGVHMHGGDKLDIDAVVARLGELVPHRLRKGASFYEVSVNQSLLRFDPRVFPQSRGSLQVSTWKKDTARAQVIADAFLKVALHVAQGGPAPTDEELRMLNGPPLAELARLDPKVPIEEAAKAFTSAFPDGKCHTPTDLIENKTQLVCELEVDHPFVQRVAFAWLNAPEAHLESVGFDFWNAGKPDAERALSLAGACLDRALGDGVQQVVDHARGTSIRSWNLAPAGDRAVLDPRRGLVVTVPEGAPTSAPPSFAPRFEAIVQTLGGCSG